jgi:hypothetical protein
VRSVVSCMARRAAREGGVLYGGGRERPRVRAGLACVSLCDVQYQTEATHESLLLRALRHLSQHLTPGHTKRDTCQTSLRPWAVPHANHCPPTPPGTRLPMRRSRSAVYAVLYPRASARDQTRRTHAPDAQAVHDNTAPLSALAVFARPPSHGIPLPTPQQSEPGCRDSASRAAGLPVSRETGDASSSASSIEALRSG